MRNSLSPLSTPDKRFAFSEALRRSARRLRASKTPFRFVLGSMLGRVYRAYSLTVLGIDIPVDTRIGSNLRIYHGLSIVVSSAAVLGDNVVLRQGTTIGASGGRGSAPTIGNGVDIGANVTIIGAISIGDNAQIGAGAVVTRDVPRDAVAVGNPAKVIMRTGEGVGPSPGS
jgi:putative colanic acid biosynthesis acetyltransferase WcaB